MGSPAFLLPILPRKQRRPVRERKRRTDSKHSKENNDDDGENKNKTGHGHTERLSGCRKTPRNPCVWTIGERVNAAQLIVLLPESDLLPGDCGQVSVYMGGTGVNPAQLNWFDWRHWRSGGVRWAWCVKCFHRRGTCAENEWRQQQKQLPDVTGADHDRSPHSPRSEG